MFQVLRKFFSINGSQVCVSISYWISKENLETKEIAKNKPVLRATSLQFYSLTL